MFHFLDLDDVLTLHQRVIEEFGGRHGMRDRGALESALAAAVYRAHYEGASLAI